MLSSVRRLAPALAAATLLALPLAAQQQPAALAPHQQLARAIY